MKEYIEITMAVATSITKSAEINDKRIRLFEYFKTFTGTSVQNQVLEIVDMFRKM